MTHLLGFIALTLILSVALCGSKEEWKKRTIYQLLTDRFYRGNGDTSPCKNLHKYCGGTFKGIKDQIQYIKRLGFDAIWISPIPENMGEESYHGYAFLNMYKVNPYFGTPQELKDLVDECHKQGIWVMLDVVANHATCVGEKYEKISPFNKAEHYHKYCEIDFNKMWQDRAMRENCRLFCLLDLDQNNPYVREQLLHWVKDAIKTFGFDGLRIDTVAHVPLDFWKDYAAAAGVFQTGEVFTDNSAIVAEYNTVLDSLLNYPMYDAIRKVFNAKQSMYEIRVRIIDIQKHFKDPSVLANFVDNHDNARFLNITNNIKLFQNSLAFILFCDGIPIVYYGSEQAFHGGNDPQNREALWTHMKTDSEMYKFTQKTVDTRKRYKVWEQKHIERFVENHVYFFTRGLVLICTTNTEEKLSVTVGFHSYNEGQKLCNIYDSRDCVTVTKKVLQITMQGVPKIYVPA